MFRLLMSEEMGGLRCLLLVLLLSSLQAVGGKDSGSDCAAPILVNGYYVPEENNYHNSALISYSCEKGYKPALEGWWAIIQCVNGAWSHQPECIGVNDCTAPDVPVNAKPRQPLTWTKNGKHVGFDCEGAYELEGSSTMKCENGNWTSTVSCKKREDACGEPPFVNNAVITQKYQDVFAANEEVKYECEEGFTLDGGEKCLCQSGNWSEPPTCRGHEDGGGLGTVDLGKHKRVEDCGPRPVLDNGGIAFQDKWSLIYKCSPFYKLQGLAKVACNSKGEWTPKPTCLEPCMIPKGKPRDDIKEVPYKKYLPTGDHAWFDCVNFGWYYARGVCISGQMAYGQCGWKTTLDAQIFTKA